MTPFSVELIIWTDFIDPAAAVSLSSGFGDAERDPVDFTTAPSLAVPVALKHAGLTIKVCKTLAVNYLPHLGMW